jgi:hypothetical protein
LTGPDRLPKIISPLPARPGHIVGTGPGRLARPVYLTRDEVRSRQYSAQLLPVPDDRAPDAVDRIGEAVQLPLEVIERAQQVADLSVGPVQHRLHLYPDLPDQSPQLIGDLGIGTANPGQGSVHSIQSGESGESIPLVIGDHHDPWVVGATMFQGLIEIGRRSHQRDSTRSKIKGQRKQQKNQYGPRHEHPARDALLT